MTGVTSDRTTFGPLSVATDARCLQPRAWTLAQSQWTAALAETAPPGPILELCAGVGHIGLAAAVLSGRALVQVDVNPTACRLAEHNAETAGLAGRVEVRNAPMQEALGEHERFPLVLADPPYLTDEEAQEYPDDPPLAVRGGPDGFDLVAQCLQVAAGHLLAGGSMVLQVRGRPQADEVADRLGRSGAPALALQEVREYGPDRALVLILPVDEPS